MIEMRDYPLAECLPRVLPNGWVILQAFGDGYACQDRTGLRVIASTADMEDGRDWLHVSLSRADRLPSYADLKYVKEVFIAKDKWAAQLFPPVNEHVNIHQFCLHLWVPLTGSLPWPNFGKDGTI